VEGHLTRDDAAAAEGGGTLFVVSTPIGNMGDFSFRAVEVLRSVHAILAEDTRHSRHLLDRYEIKKPMLAYHEHNEAKMTPRLVERLRAGESLALVSDAGTPLVSDPGFRLVRAAADAGITITPIPGASAVLAALVASGLDVGTFTFFGFLTRTGSDRRAALDEISTLAHTAVVYESPNRLAQTLAELEQRGSGDRAAAVAREMTKQFEEVRRGTVSELRAYYEGRVPRGEVVLLIGPRAEIEMGEEEIRSRVRVLRASGMSSRDIAASVARDLGVSKRVAYQMAQQLAAPNGEGTE
jgi:16S rRNA (cytidine1402-2'-O)-methyltransferase